MKDLFKQMWIEHKSRDKKPEDAIEDDTTKALEKMISILSTSLGSKLVRTKEKITSVREKTEK